MVTGGDIPQLPGLRCLDCDVCCRFSDPTTEMAPCFAPDERERALARGLGGTAFSGAESGIGEPALLTADARGTRCPAFDRASNSCLHYAARPFDCRLYPLVLMYDADGANVLLAADLACPVVERLANTPVLRAFVREAARRIETDLLDKAVESRSAIGEHKPWMEEAVPLPELTRRVCRSDLGLRRLSLSACEALRPLAEAESVRLAAQTLPAVRVWADMMDLHWTTVGDRVVLIAAGDGPAFALCPPLGAGPAAPAIDLAEDILRALNPPDIALRTQEVDDAAWPAYEERGCRVTRVFREYVYERRALVGLAGRAYKGKRSGRNRFEKRFAPVFRAFEPEDLPACMDLFRRWSRQRGARHSDDVYRIQLQSSAAMFCRSLCEAGALGLRARVVEAEGRVAACTVGYPVPGGEQFAVLTEIADPECKGAAAWIFQRFCSEAEGFALVNAMTDSGLPSLARAKELWRPLHRERSRIVERRA